MVDLQSPYRHGGVALLRAAAVPLSAGQRWWPDLGDRQSCEAWLREMWSWPGFADAVRQASPILATRVDALCAGRALSDKQIRRAATATARYLMRATGRPTPFGLFAGVAPVSLRSTSGMRWGEGHRATARVDTQWLADVIDRLEAHPELLERLDVVFTNLAVQRGNRLEAPFGPNRVSVRYTGAVRAAREAAASPVRFGDLTDKIAETFPAANGSMVCGLLTDLVRQGLLITCLRAPLTVVDPLGYLIDQLRAVQADTVEAVGALYRGVLAVHRDLEQHNRQATAGAGQARVRTAVIQRMAGLSRAGRTPLAVDLRLDCEVRLPASIADELQRAAWALLRMTRRPTGGAAWHDFHAAFCDRYGTGTLVPLTEAVDPDTGIGFPAGYPGSLLPASAEAMSERDERLLALAWQALADGSREIVLTDETIAAVTDGDRFDARYIPPHLELAARIHAASVAALQHGEYGLVVSPARSAGTLTSRFTPTASGSGLQDVYRKVPTIVEGALPVQLSMPPVYPHSENISRIPAYLPHVLSLDEHRSPDEHTITLDDLALTATHERLYLVSVSRQRVIEPQVFHALALDKQLPPLGRFLAHLPRAFTARWHEFDWGPHTHRMPYLPRVRYGRAVLAPARWRLTTDDLPAGDAVTDEWRQALHRWRQQWRCPDTVELRDADRTLRLTFAEPAHLTILHAHLGRHGDATLTEAAPAEAFGWIDGRVHEVAVPLAITHPAAPAPRLASAPQLASRETGQLPGAADAAWLYAKIHTHPERFDEILADQLPHLLATVGADPTYWFVRYRSPHETDHLRMRIHIPSGTPAGALTVAVGEWTHRLRRDGVAGRLVFDTYYPEVGRYGNGHAMRAAETVFAADSHAVVAGLRHRLTVDPTALAALGLVDLVCGFLGNRADGMRWLTSPADPVAPPADRAVAEQAITLVRDDVLPNVPGWPSEVVEAWQTRAAALAAYRRQLPADADIDAVLESLLHMHHNRALGIDPEREATCRRLARHAALAWQARNGHHR
ncbi:lantibiotic dehydratase [Planosporangium thailandense]|uniref:Lantibiotic dehydratase n=2 Tax=Planosporangium thailandense TaxID=765197 RepID=A0ABX0Y6G4_9ACTN|nr:lantibiotic dehydratase [Planosporangium thailandense]